MNPLSIGLKILFARRKGDDLLHRKLHKSRKKTHANGGIDTKWWQDEVVSEIKHATYDHADSLRTQLEDVWMTAPEHECRLSYTKSPTEFNVLLNFTRDILKESEGTVICAYDKLLRWHHVTGHVGEDLLVCAFLAAKDQKFPHDRQHFQWHAFIGHDNRVLNEVLSRPKADIHMHLVGSSLNFEINWLSLMNHIGRKGKSLKAFGEDICRAAYKAAAIRMYLWSMLNGRKVDAGHMQRVALKNASQELVHDISKLQGDIDVLRLDPKGNRDLTKYDYALRIRTLVFAGDMHRSHMKYFAGERALLYGCFCKIYSNDWEVDSLQASLFYAYLLYKNEIRHALLQLNDVQGFSNFNNYERRKDAFIKDGSDYAKLLNQTVSATSFVRQHPDDHLEMRIAPKRTYREVRRQIERLRGDFSTRGSDVLKRGLAAPELIPGRVLVYHFIKKADKRDTSQMVGDRLKHAPTVYRHYNLRETVKTQALAINRWRSLTDDISILRGIDAANSELLCRPEVFAQAFRFLHDFTPERLLIKGALDVRQLGRTFHVGEDFLDIVDGLRAVDEVLRYMSFGNGDRLGHALVLGVDVQSYYDSYQRCITMSRGVLFDNVVWLMHRASKLDGYQRVADDLTAVFNNYRLKLYGDSATDPYTFYQAWLLRGDNPESYIGRGYGLPAVGHMPWSLYNLNQTEEACEARESLSACGIYHRYHYDLRVREAYRKQDSFYPSDDMVRMIGLLQESMLDEIEERRIAIETNPTSNLRIGQMEAYMRHPVFRFYNHGIVSAYPPHHIDVSVNTDDRGVFGTSLERELSLVAAVLERESDNSPRDVYRWIDDIRGMAIINKL